MWRNVGRNCVVANGSVSAKPAKSQQPISLSGGVISVNGWRNINQQWQSYQRGQRRCFWHNGLAISAMTANVICPHQQQQRRQHQRISNGGSRSQLIKRWRKYQNETVINESNGDGVVNDGNGGEPICGRR